MLLKDTNTKIHIFKLYEKEQTVISWEFFHLMLLVTFIHIVCVTAHPFDHWQTLPVQLLPQSVPKVCAVVRVLL